ncbi:lyase [Lithospermum erythrorhizon]|uniref:Lyase n=1 Tax=Lithospermum erythrorhizon TaxID=34254 RepID=A0AAV3QPT0_LITER
MLLLICSLQGYQFWVQTDAQGGFRISNIVPGTYNVYAWVPGVIGDYKNDQNIEIKGGSNINLGELVFNPPRSGPTVWEIGIPDRTAAEFFIPDPAKGLSNSLFNGHPEKWRQYGLWDRYTDLYPNGDLVYNIGTSDYKKDWFFAHLNRRVGDKYVPTTWQIKFPITNANGAYTLRIALASVTYAQLQVMVNDPNKAQPIFSTNSYNSGGRDNAIARHGIHGLYWLFEANIPAGIFVNGINTIFIKQQTAGAPFNGVMYDYLRLEGPTK